MDLTKAISKIIGPVLLLRATSILIDRNHFVEILRGLDREVATVSFSMFPIALLTAFIAFALVPLDSRTLAAFLLREAGILNLILTACFAVGAYFTWFGYFAPVTRKPDAEAVRDGAPASE